MMIKKMMIRLMLIFLMLGYSLVSLSQCPQLIWFDEFEENVLDATKWSYQIGDGCDVDLCGWGNFELQSYQQENVVVKEGILQLIARKERVDSSDYTSGRIRSIHKGDWKYGRFEARIKFPGGNGFWPAFWMLPTEQAYGHWPMSGEIDIVEIISSKPDSIFGNIHYGKAWPHNVNMGADYVNPDLNFTDEFHDFAVEWEEGEIRWLVDGYLYQTLNSKDIDPHHWPFDQRFHFLLNVAIGGRLGGKVDDTVLPVSMDVDYVRVYDGFKPYLKGSDQVDKGAKGVAYTVGNSLENMTIDWEVPADAKIIERIGSDQIVVDFGKVSGYVTANIVNACGSESLFTYVQIGSEDSN